MREKPKIHQLLIQFINYVWYLLLVSALHCHLQGAFPLPSERCSIEEIVTHHVSKHNSPIHNIDCSSIEHLSEGTRNDP
jgi:hypothetical protein